MNLALLQQYGANSWRIHNYLLESTAKNLDKAVEDLKQLTVEVNRERKNFQVRDGVSNLRSFTLTSSRRPTSEHSLPRSRRGGQSLFQACYKLRWRTSHWRWSWTNSENARSSCPTCKIFLVLRLLPPNGGRCYHSLMYLLPAYN